MSYLELVDKFINETGIGRKTEKKELEKPNNKKIKSDDIPLLTLSEFKSCDYAVQILSSVLNCNVWFCPDEQMVEEILEDDPTAVCYTADELQKLIKLGPGCKDFLKKIHDTKTVFDNSRIIDTKRKL